MIAHSDHILSRYDVSPKNGFLPEDAPLQRLQQAYYQPWETIMDNLPGLIESDLVKSTVDAMPPLNTSQLSNDRDWRRAYLVLSFMTHAYIWAGHEPAQILPPSLCVPYLEVAEFFGLPTTATYAAFNLWNWTPRSEKADLTNPENIRMLHTFTNTLSEEWFYAISVAIEADGARIIPTTLECFDAVRVDNTMKVAELLTVISDTIIRLGNILDRMHDKCDPHVFYHRIRPFLAGSKGMATAGLAKGVFYDEGHGQGTWRQYSGGSNAQSSLIQLLDIILGIEHYATDSTMSVSERAAQKKKQGYIEEMRRYMPAEHKLFLRHVTDIANIRAHATQPNADPGVRRAYVTAVDSLTIFRDKHINIVARYIIAPSRMPPLDHNNTTTNIATTSTRKTTEGGVVGAELCGTGGTHLMPFLKQTRDETKQAGIMQSYVCLDT